MSNKNVEIARKAASTIYAREVIGEAGLLSQLQRKLKSAEPSFSREERINAQTRLLNIKRSMRIFLNTANENEEEGTVYRAVADMQQVVQALQNPQLKWFTVPLPEKSFLEFALRAGMPSEAVEKMNDFLGDVSPLGKTLVLEQGNQAIGAIELVYTQNETRATEIGPMAHLKRMFGQARLDFERFRGAMLSSTGMDFTDPGFANSGQYNFVFTLRPENGKLAISTEAKFLFTSLSGEKQMLQVEVEKRALTFCDSTGTYRLEDNFRL